MRKCQAPETECGEIEVEGFVAGLRRIELTHAHSSLQAQLQLHHSLFNPNLPAVRVGEGEALWSVVNRVGCSLRPSSADGWRCASVAVKATVDFAGTFQPAVSSPPVAFFLCANPYQAGDEMLTQLTMQVRCAPVGGGGESNHAADHLFTPTARLG